MISRRTFLGGCAGLAAGLLRSPRLFAGASAGLPDPAPYAQLWNSSCELAAATLALRMLGQAVTEADVIVRLRMDERLPEMQGGRILRWGNPNAGFVGTLDGDLPWNPGVGAPGYSYGVYATPLARAIADFDPAVTAVTGVPTEQLRSALQAGRPIVVWLPDQLRFRQLADAGRSGIWTSWEGEPVHFAFREHTQVLVSYGPDGYRVANVGYQITQVPFINIWSEGDFDRAFGVLNRMAMIL